MFYDRNKFYAAIKSTLSTSAKLSTSQQNGFEILLAEGEKRNFNTEWIAYVLATTWHETGYTMQPVRETFANSDAQAIARLDAAWAKGQMKSVKTAYWRKGYFGRGYVQLTWDYNYKKMGEWLGIDLLKNPALALDPKIAAQIIYEGMLRGMFTTKSLANYLDGVTSTQQADYTAYMNARRIINGTDKAAEIAGYAQKIEKALRSAEGATTVKSAKRSLLGANTNDYQIDETASADMITLPKVPGKTKSAFSSSTIWTSIAGFFMSILGILGNLDPVVQVLLILILAGGFGWIIWRRVKGNKDIENLLK